MPPLKKFTFEVENNPAITVVIEAYDEYHAEVLLKLFLTQMVKS